MGKQIIAKLRQCHTSIVQRCTQWLATHSYGKTIVLAVVTLLLFFATFVSQTLYDHSLYHPVDVVRFQNVLQEKETYAREEMAVLHRKIQSNHLDEVFHETRLYEESEKKDVSFHIYKGEDLVYWSNNLIALKSVSKLDGLKDPFVTTDNADAVVLQSFCREYRIVAFIKIKDHIFPKKNDPNNLFASAFQLDGSTALYRVGEKHTLPVRLKSGEAAFSLDQMYVSGENKVFLNVTHLLWILTVAFLFFMAGSWMMVLPRLYPDDERKVKRVKYLILFGLLLVMILSSLARFPSSWFSNSYFSNVTYKTMLVPTISHLFLYVLFSFGFSYIFYRCWKVQPLYDSYQGWSLRLRIIIAKLVPFPLLFLLYSLMRELVMQADVNLAVPNIQDVPFVTFVLLLMALFWVYVFYRVLCTIRLFYADRRNVRFLLWVHLALTLVSFLVALTLWSWMEALFVLIVSCLILFVDLYELYYTVSSFLYTVPIFFVLINMIVSLSYKYGVEKNTKTFFDMACDMGVKNCVYEDEIAESVLKENYSSLRNDERLFEWMTKDSFRMAYDIQGYLKETYFKTLEEKYDLEVELCDAQQPIAVRKRNYEETSIRNLVEISNDLRLIEKTSFFVSLSESLALSYIGVVSQGVNSLYLKFYRKPDYDRLSFWEHSLLRSKSMQHLSRCKYKNSVLTYSEGDFHYPGQMDWLKNGSGEDHSFSLNYYTHYVHYFDGGDSCAVCSVPERQSYIYVILISYLFAIYLLLALVYFSLRESTKRFRKRNSLLTKMQRRFVVPVFVAFLVLAMATFPFFIDQFEKSTFNGMKEKSTTVLQRVQQVVMTGDNLDKECNLLSEEMRELSSVLHADVMLYGKDGRLSLSTRPLFMSNDKKESSLVIPKVKFLNRPDLFLTENMRSIKCYSYYTQAYNLKNECVGFVGLISDRDYSLAQTETINVLVVVVDIYIFVTIISIFIIWLLNKLTTKPLQEMTEQISQVHLTGSNTLIDYKEDDEIGELVKQYNNMVVQLKDSADKLARSEREFAWREMARRIAHEIKNPLTPMKLSVQQCLRKRSMDPEGFDAYFQKTCSILIDQIDNLSNIASSFSSFAKAAESRCEKMDVVDKLRSTVELFANNSEDVTFSFDDHGCEHAQVWMDDKQVLQIFNNLFRNAIQAIPDGRQGMVRVSCEVKDGKVLISIADNGCGVSEEVKEKMFQPNFTTKTSGMGLGLAIVKNILTSSNGDICFESELGKGTCFYVSIPVCD